MECKLKDWGLGALSKTLFGVQNWLGNVQLPILPIHQRWEKGSTLAAQRMLGGTDTMVSWVGFFVKMGQKLGKVPIKSRFQGMDGTCYAIKLLQHGPTNPLSPQPPPPWGLAGLGGDDKSDKWSAS